MKTPPIKKICPECGGSGIKRYGYPTYDDEVCSCCLGEKEIYNYLTPEQYVDWMQAEGGEPEYILLDSDFVWCFVGGGWYLHEDGDTSKNNIRVVYIKKQPKLDNNWRPE